MKQFIAFAIAAVQWNFMEHTPDTVLAFAGLWLVVLYIWFGKGSSVPAKRSALPGKRKRGLAAGSIRETALRDASYQAKRRRDMLMDRLDGRIGAEYNL